MTREDVDSVNIVAHFLIFIGKKSLQLNKNLNIFKKRISLPYGTLNELLLDHVKCTNFDCCKEGNFHKLIRQDMKDSCK